MGVKDVIEVALTVVGIIAGLLLGIDRWVHARERKEESLELRTTGRASLQSQIDGLAKMLSEQDARYTQSRAAFLAELVRAREEQERLRLERAGVLAHELADLHKAIEGLQAGSAEQWAQRQSHWHRLDRRLQAVELRQKELFRILERRAVPRATDHEHGKDEGQ